MLQNLIFEMYYMYSGLSIFTQIYVTKCFRKWLEYVLRQVPQGLFILEV